MWAGLDVWYGYIKGKYVHAYQLKRVQKTTFSRFSLTRQLKIHIPPSRQCASCYSIGVLKKTINSIIHYFLYTKTMFKNEFLTPKMIPTYFIRLQSRKFLQRLGWVCPTFFDSWDNFVGYQYDWNRCAPWANSHSVHLLRE